MTNAFGDHHFNEAIIAAFDKFGAGKIVAQIYGHTHTDSFRLIGVSSEQNFPVGHFQRANPARIFFLFPHCDADER